MAGVVAGFEAGLIASAALTGDVAVMRRDVAQCGLLLPVARLDNPTDALANAVPYLQAFGHTVLAWIWLGPPPMVEAMPDIGPQNGVRRPCGFSASYSFAQVQPASTTT